MNTNKTVARAFSNFLTEYPTNETTKLFYQADLKYWLSVTALNKDGHIKLELNLKDNANRKVFSHEAFLIEAFDFVSLRNLHSCYNNLNENGKLEYGIRLSRVNDAIAHVIQQALYDHAHITSAYNSRWMISPTGVEIK